MDSATQILDPDGEIIIILRHENHHQSDEPVQESSETSQTRVDAPVGEQPNTDTDTEKQPDIQEFRYQVSAKHLTFGSPVFKKLLTGGWKESTMYAEKGSVEITANDWDDEAFMILLRAIHGQYYQVPQKFSIYMLAEIGVIADYYDCKEALFIMTDIWVKALEEEIPAEYSMDVMRWVWISWFFSLPEQFVNSTSVAMSSSNGSITKYGFPIPDKVIAHMNAAREANIASLLDSLHERLARFLMVDVSQYGPGSGCCFECKSIMYGALAQQMESHGILSPRPEVPYVNLNYGDLLTKVSSLRSPVWSVSPKASSYIAYSDVKPHDCPWSKLASMFRTSPTSVTGLNLQSTKNK